MMNIKTHTERIQNIIRRFKQQRNKIKPEDILPYSTDDFWTEPEVQALDSTVTNAQKSLSILPANSLFSGKIPSHQTKNITANIRVYPNRHQEKLIEVQSTDGNKVLLGMIENSRLIDMRVPGGAIKRKYIDEQAGLNNWLQSYTDVGRYDGSPVGLGQVIIVDIPDTALNSHKPDKITESVKKYVAAGLFPIVKTYTTV